MALLSQLSNGDAFFGSVGAAGVVGPLCIKLEVWDVANEGVKYVYHEVVSGKTIRGFEDPNRLFVYLVECELKFNLIKVDD